MSELCNCGKPTRYMCMKNGEQVGSCNKYFQCATYEDLRKQVHLKNDLMLRYENTLQNIVNNDAEDYQYKAWAKEALTPSEAFKEVTKLIGEVENTVDTTKCYESDSSSLHNTDGSVVNYPESIEPAWMENIKQVWCEDDALYAIRDPDRPTVKTMWSEYIGCEFKDDPVVETYDGGDAMYYLHLSSAIHCNSFDGSSIYLMKQKCSSE